MFWMWTVRPACIGVVILIAMDGSGVLRIVDFTKVRNVNANRSRRSRSYELPKVRERDGKCVVIPLPGLVVLPCLRP